MKFQGIILLSGKTSTGIEVPKEVITGLGSHKRPAVLVTIKGYTYRTTIVGYAGEFKIPLSAEHRERAGVKAGDKIEITLELDTKPREVAVPKDLAKALRNNKLENVFESLAPSKKKWVVIPIEEAKSIETRQSRIEKTIEKLKEGKV